MSTGVAWLEPPPGLLNPSTNTFTVIGYGSLVSKESALQTMPQLQNFRTGRIHGFVRVFNLVSIINIIRGYATGNKIATCTAVRKEGAGPMRVCLFDVPAEEWEVKSAISLRVQDATLVTDSFAKREARLRHEVIEYEEDEEEGEGDEERGERDTNGGGAEGGGEEGGGGGEEGRRRGKGRRGYGVLCTAYSDEEYRAERCRSEEEYQQQVGQHYAGKLYRDDLLPVPRYLDLVLTAHASLGKAFEDDFVRTSFLGDGSPLANYLPPNRV